MSQALIDLRGTTKEIENAHIGGSSRESYTSTLVLLLMYLFDSERKDVAFAEETLARFEAANNKDHSECPEQDRPHLREAAREVLWGIGEDAAPHNQVLVENLTYEDFSGFMNTKSKRAIVPKDLALEWARQSKGGPRKGRKRRKQQDNEDDGADDIEAVGGEVGGDKVEVLLPLSLSVYTNIQSSISFLYKECRVQMPARIFASIGKYIRGMKRISRQMKQHLSLKIVEGKRVMTRDVYHFISRVLLESDEKEHIFARLFFSLDWYVSYLLFNCSIISLSLTSTSILVCFLFFLGT